MLDVEAVFVPSAPLRRWLISITHQGGLGAGHYRQSLVNFFIGDAYSEPWLRFEKHRRRGRIDVNMKKFLAHYQQPPSLASAMILAYRRGEASAIEKAAVLALIDDEGGYAIRRRHEKAAHCVDEMTAPTANG